MIRQFFFPKVRVRMHTGAMTEKEEVMVCAFLTITNVSNRDIEVTHTWMQFGDKQIPILNPSRMLPKRLKPMEIWETWFPFTALAFHTVRAGWWNKGRVRLSTGEVYKSKFDKNVPSMGQIPGYTDQTAIA